MQSEHIQHLKEVYNKKYKFLYMLKDNKKGFTIIELLIVIAIIGLLATISIVALNGARKKGRDAARIGNVRQIQTALELYFNDQNAYPINTTAVILGGATAKKLCSTGFVALATVCTKTYMGNIQANPLPGGANFSYTSPALGPTYALTFTLEEAVGGYLLGAHTATQDGIN